MPTMEPQELLECEYLQVFFDSKLNISVKRLEDNKNKNNNSWRTNR